MDLKTKADMDYLIRVASSAVSGIVDYKAASSTDEDLARFRRLAQHRYIERAGNGAYRITAAGLQAAQEAEELREQSAEYAAEDDREHIRRAKREFRFSLLSAIIGGVVTLLIEHIFFKG